MITATLPTTTQTEMMTVSGGGGEDTAEKEPERDPEGRCFPSTSHSPMKAWPFLGVRTASGPERPPTSAVVPGWLLLVAATVVLSPPVWFSEAPFLRASVSVRVKGCQWGQTLAPWGPHSNADTKFLTTTRPRRRFDLGHHLLGDDEQTFDLIIGVGECHYRNRNRL